MNNRIKNLEGWSPSSEETPEYFGAKGALSFRNQKSCVIQQIKYYTQQNDTQHNGFVVMLGISYAKCHVLNVVKKLSMLSEV